LRTIFAVAGGARPNQFAPLGDWIHWLMMAGRGFGKTRVGTEQVRRWKTEISESRNLFFGARVSFDLGSRQARSFPQFSPQAKASSASIAIVQHPPFAILVEALLTKWAKDVPTSLFRRLLVAMQCKLYGIRM
jgi:hypothetical protein